MGRFNSADPGWRRLYQIGGIAALLAEVAIRARILLWRQTVVLRGENWMLGHILCNVRIIRVDIESNVVNIRRKMK